jgi:hypothetical protein
MNWLTGEAHASPLQASLCHRLESWLAHHVSQGGKQGAQYSIRGKGAASGGCKENQSEQGRRVI